jgi:predicted ATPase
MSNLLANLKVRNYRSLADLSVETGPLNVLFGPNGAGKSSFLDTIWFVRDCAIRGVDLAASKRSHGIGMLWDGADEGEPVSISLATGGAEYELTFGFSSGRIEPFLGERLHSVAHDKNLIDRTIGDDKASFYNTGLDQHLPVQLREPLKLSLGRYLDSDPRAREAADLDRLLRFVHFYHSRSFFLYRIKKFGSEVGHETWLQGRGDNVWSVLRNLHDKRSVDNRYDTIMELMAESFPSFDGLVFEQTGPVSIYANFLEKGRGRSIAASGVADGHIQMLLMLAALFSEGQERDSLIMLDEPEVSLHPWALTVLAKAVRLAADRWNKQVFIATHSPVLISQFKPEHILATEIGEEGTRLTRVSEMKEMADLLEDYAVGSLYMAEQIAPQGAPKDSQTTLFE